MLDKKHRNTLILVLSLLILLFSTYYFFLGIRLEERGSFAKIGDVFKKDNDLRRKMNGSLSWVDIDHSAKIFPGDKVFTGSSSLAQLHLLDLAEVGMNSSTLLRIDPKSLESMVGFQGGLGFFTTRLSGKLTQTSVKLKNASFDLKGVGTEIHVNGFEDKTMVTALSGAVSYQTAQGGGGLQKLSPNQLLGMNRAGLATVVNLPAKLISPTTAEELVILPKVPVEFKWQTLNPNVPLMLQLSQSPTFEKVFSSEEVTGKSETQLELDSSKQGVMYWRIVEKGKEEYFHAQQFQYQPLEPPVIYDPAQNQNYPVAVPEGIEFSWEKKFDFQYEGEIQQLSGGIGGAQKFQSPHPSFLVRQLTNGHYQVRVRGFKNNLFTEWTPWRPFTIGDVDRNGIELVSPMDQGLATLVFPEKEVRLEWTSGAVQTQVQIAKDEKFKDVVFEAITDKKFIQWKPKKEGRFFWRVVGVNRGKSGIVRSFLVKEPSLALVSPRSKAGFLYRDPGFENISFKWEDVSLDDHYLFELSNSPSFASIYEKATLDQPAYELKFPKREETLYWRVKTNHQTSEARMFRIYPMPELEPAQIEMVKVQIQGETTIFGGTTDRAPTQLGPDFVEIFLPQIEKAKSYKIEIMRDIGGKNMVISKTLLAPLFRWNEPTPGEYYWRLTYWDQLGNKSPPSSLATLMIIPKDKDVDGNPFTRVPY